MCFNAEDPAKNLHYARIYYPGCCWEFKCACDEGSDSIVSAEAINGIHISNYIYHFPLGNSSPSLCSHTCVVTYGFDAASDATVSAKAISDVCLSNEGQPSVLARNRSEEEGDYVGRLWEDGLMYRKETVLRKRAGKANWFRLHEELK